MTAITTVRIKNLVALTSVILSSVLLAAPRSAGQEGQPKPQGKTSDTFESLPEGEGRPIMLQACVQCHDLKNIVSQRKGVAGWRRTVDEMVWRGAPLMAGEAETVVNYLTASFGPDRAVTQSRETDSKNSDETGLEQYLPEGKGREVVLESCVRCHGLRKTISQRKNEAEWRRVIKEMIRLGARLTRDQAEALTSYLTKSFGPDRPLSGRER